MSQPSRGARRLAAVTIVFAVAAASASWSLSGESQRLPDAGVYEGPTRDGLFHGKGRMEWPNGAYYEGGFRDGLFSGRGVYRMASGEIYTGEFARGMMAGHGRLEMPGGTVYAGAFSADAFNGLGVLTGPSGYRYQGEFQDGHAHGEGVMEYADGSVYEGRVAYGEPHGRGRLETPDGTVFEGEFEHGRMRGDGELRAPTGEVYRGSFEDWRLQGQGEFQDAQGNIYRGRFQDGWLTGEGVYIGADGSRYEGGFQGLSFHGEGMLHNADGSVYEGEFQHGYYHGEGVLTLAEPRDDGTMRLSGPWTYGERADAGDTAEQRASVEAAVYAQSRLLKAAIAGVAAGDPKAIELYLLTVAGDADQAVFRRESAFVQARFAERFDTGNRSLALVNGRDTLGETPLATRTSLRRALQGVAERMDRDQDILFLYLTSHGSEDHRLYLNPLGLEVNDLPAPALAEMLAEAGIRWKVVVVSACYSGGFIDPLRDNNTLVLTAARADRQSFGCDDDNDFTYFGRAYFDQALPRADSFVDAFEAARGRIAEREADEGRTPSLPQMHAGEAIVEHLRRWRQSLPDGTWLATEAGEGRLRPGQ